MAKWVSILAIIFPSILLSGSYWKLNVENGSWKWKLLEVESWKLKLEVGSGSYWKLLEVESWKWKLEVGSCKWKLLEVEVRSGSCVIDYSELVIDY